MPTQDVNRRLWARLVEHEPALRNETPIEQYEVRFNYTARPHCYIIFTDQAICLFQKARLKRISFSRRFAKAELVWDDFPPDYAARTPFGHKGDLVTVLGLLPNERDLAGYRGPKNGMITTVPAAQTSRFVRTRQEYGQSVKPLIARWLQRHEQDQ